MQSQKHSHHGIDYIVRGDHPTLMIWSGTHGDETEVTLCVSAYLAQNDKELPDYIYIPEISPSAVALKTRRNKFDRDLNRHFRKDTVDDEVKTVMEIVQQYSVPLCIMFHEDPDRTSSFYMYDSDVMQEKELMFFRHMIEQTGASLYTGIDDDADPHLSLHVERGYISTTIEPLDIDTGFSMRWVIENNIAKRIFNPEIPGKADMVLKQSLVDAVFSFSLTLI